MVVVNINIWYLVYSVRYTSRQDWVVVGGSATHELHVSSHVQLASAYVSVLSRVYLTRSISLSPVHLNST